jgi:hypothetical protein
LNALKSGSVELSIAAIVAKRGGSLSKSNFAAL